jgi:hypothetical protein
MTTMTMEAVKENPAENKQSDPLPEANARPSEDLKQQRVPEFRGDEAEDGPCYDYE